MLRNFPVPRNRWRRAGSPPAVQESPGVLAPGSRPFGLLPLLVLSLLPLAAVACGEMLGGAVSDERASEFVLVPAQEVGPSGSGGETGARVDTVLVADGIRNRLEAGLAHGQLTAGGQNVLSPRALPDFYRERNHEPAWLEGSRLTAGGRALLDAVRGVEVDGLRPRDYHRAALDSLVPRLGEGGADELRRRVDVDVLLTDAFLIFGSHLLLGRIHPETIDPEWIANRRGADLKAVLAEAVHSDDVAGALDALRPRGDGYGAMRQALAQFRRVAASGGWDPVPAGETLEEGARGPRVARLRTRLAASGDLGSGGEAEGDPDAFDGELARAVRAFQRRHGLDVDGAVGARTTLALNTPVEERIAQLEVNMERWRWLPAELGARHFLVNAADFTVDVVEDGVRLRRIRGIVGRSYRQTPVFSGTMTYLVLAPYWHVPPGIAQNDQLPRIRQNSGYVADQRMVLIDAATNRPVDPHSIDWGGMTGAHFNRHFRLRQDPGPANALGDVKFMFPNRYNVYLHDTPARDMFARTTRDFSSGCIRVEDALGLAEFLLAREPGWDRARIDQVVRQGVERTVRLSEPWQVHLQYWTSWVDDEGVLHFRDDIYSRDGRVRAAMEELAPLA